MGASLKMTKEKKRKISVCFQGKSFKITAIQVYDTTTDTKETEVDQFYEDLENLRELKPKKRHPINHRRLECNSRKSGDDRVTGRFGSGVQNEAGQRLREFCQENILVIANTLFQQRQR